jgi:phosphoglucosamine mutase
LTRHLEAIGGVMISASHNPPEDNGIKFFAADGTKLTTDIQQEIEAALRGDGQHLGAMSAAVWGRSLQQSHLVEQYAESLYLPLQTTVDLTGMKVVLDLAWGAATRLAASVFTRMGAEVICLHQTPDGDRINVNCGSTHLEPLRAAVQEHGADLGFAFDGDADRVMAVDSNGRMVNGDYILYFWGKTLKAAGQLPSDLIVSTVMANLGFERAWSDLGGHMIRTPVGDQHVHAAMQHRGAMLGGEQSGHILCHHYSMTGDGILTALHLAGLVQQSGTSLTDLVDSSFQTYPQLLKNVRVEDRDRRVNWKDCDALQSAIATAEAAMGDQGRVLVRASGTEPVIRVMVEAIDAELANHWTDNLVLAVQQHLG